MRDLPAGVIRMNDECLKLRDHTAGYQTVEDIQAVVGEAIGLHKKPMADDDYIDEAMVPSQLRLWFQKSETQCAHRQPMACDDCTVRAMCRPDLSQK